MQSKVNYYKDIKVVHSKKPVKQILTQTETRKIYRYNAKTISSLHIQNIGLNRNSSSNNNISTRKKKTVQKDYVTKNSMCGGVNTNSKSSANKIKANRKSSYKSVKNSSKDTETVFKSKYSVSKVKLPKNLKRGKAVQHIDIPVIKPRLNQTQIEDAQDSNDDENKYKRRKTQHMNVPSIKQASIRIKKIDIPKVKLINKHTIQARRRPKSISIRQPSIKTQKVSLRINNRIKNIQIAKQSLALRELSKRPSIKTKKIILPYGNKLEQLQKRKVLNGMQVKSVNVFTHKCKKVYTGNKESSNKYLKSKIEKEVISQIETKLSNSDDYGLKASELSIKTVKLGNSYGKVLVKKRKDTPNNEVKSLSADIKDSTQYKTRIKTASKPIKAVRDLKNNKIIKDSNKYKTQIKTAPKPIETVRNLKNNKIIKDSNKYKTQIKTASKPIKVVRDLKNNKIIKVGSITINGIHNETKSTVIKDINDDLSLNTIDKTIDTSKKIYTGGKFLHGTTAKKWIGSSQNKVPDKSILRKNNFKKKHTNIKKKEVIIKRRTLKTSVHRKVLKKTSFKKNKTALDLFKKTTKIITNTSKVLIKAISAPKILLIASLVMAFVTVISIINSVASIPASTIMTYSKDMEVYNATILKLQSEFKQEIDRLMNDKRYDKHEINYMNEECVTINNFKEIICIMAVYFEQDLKVTNEKLEFLKKLFEMTNYIETIEEPYKHKPGCKCPGHRYTTGEGGSGKRYHKPGCKCPGHIKLIVNVYNLSYQSILDGLEFNDDQREWLEVLLVQDLESLYPGLTFTSNIGSSGGLSYEEILELLENAPTTNATREEIVKTALSLVGKVKYFWGGKSSAGWNDNWGKPKIVTAAGDRTSGTYQPYGLDCSGFTDWVYKTAGVGDMLSNGGTAYQWNNTYAINANEALPGDLVFMNSPGVGGVNHTGIYIGKDQSGKNLYVHCAGGQGVVVNSFGGFKYFRRAFVNLGDE